MRHVTGTLFLAVIFAISLAPAIALRFVPDETLRYMLDPFWNIIGYRIGVSRDGIAAFAILISFVLAAVTGSALLLVLARELTALVRRAA